GARERRTAGSDSTPDQERSKDRQDDPPVAASLADTAYGTVDPSASPGSDSPTRRTEPSLARLAANQVAITARRGWTRSTQAAGRAGGGAAPVVTGAGRRTASAGRRAGAATARHARRAATAVGTGAATAAAAT